MGADLREYRLSQIAFWTAPPLLLRLSGEWVAALLVLGCSVQNARQKRRHPFERHRTTRGRRSPNKSSLFTTTRLF